MIVLESERGKYRVELRPNRAGSAWICEYTNNRRSEASFRGERGIDELEQIVINEYAGYGITLTRR